MNNQPNNPNRGLQIQDQSNQKPAPSSNAGDSLMMQPHRPIPTAMELFQQEFREKACLYSIRGGIHYGIPPEGARTHPSK